MVRVRRRHLFNRRSKRVWERATAVDKIKKVLESVHREEVRMLSVEEAVFEKAVETLLKFPAHKLSLTDATTYVLYRDFKLDEIFTLDADFKKIGAKTSF